MKNLVAFVSLAAAIAALMFSTQHAAAQATVPYTSAEWMNFGNTDVVAVEGNFLPGWTTLTGSPDLGQNLFFIATTSLSGAPDDAALWLLTFDQTHPSFGANESAELSLSGFTPGVQYQLDFFATLVYSSFASWQAQSETLEVSIEGADITTFTSSLLTDFGDTDGINEWIPQSIAFTAEDSIVNFRFNDLPVSIDPNIVGRIGIDGLSMRIVPTPGAGCLLALWGTATTRRRRRR